MDPRRTPDSEIEQMRGERAAGDSISLIARRHGKDRPWVSRLVRGLTYRGAPGPIAPAEKRVALSPEEHAAILAAVLDGFKHFGKAPSDRLLGKKLKRDRFAIARVTHRAAELYRRFESHIQKTEGCWIWKGSYRICKRTLKDGAKVETLIPRFNNGPRKAYHPCRFLWEFINQKKLSRYDFLHQVCGNPRCIRLDERHNKIDPAKGSR